MKRLILFLILAIFLLMPLTSYAQGQILWNKSDWSTISVKAVLAAMIGDSLTNYLLSTGLVTLDSLDVAGAVRLGGGAVEINEEDSTAYFKMVYINQTYTEPTNGISDSTILIISNNNVGNGVAILSILARSSGESRIYFGDQDDEDLGKIIYDHDYNAKPQMEFWSDSYRIMTLRDSSVGIGVIDPDSTLEVNGSLHVTGNGIFDGKLTTSGVVDPPAITFTAETRKTIKEKWLPTIDTEHEKVMVFWNSELEQMEVYHIEKDVFYPLSQKNRLAIMPYIIIIAMIIFFVISRRKKKSLKK